MAAKIRFGSFTEAPVVWTTRRAFPYKTIASNTAMTIGFMTLDYFIEIPREQSLTHMAWSFDQKFRFFKNKNQNLTPEFNFKFKKYY